MATSLEDIYKLGEALGALVTSVVGLIAALQKRLSQIRDVTKRGAEQGVFFFLTYTLFQYLYAGALIVCALAGFVALVGGVAKLFRPNGWSYVTPFFEDYAFQILGVALLVLLVAAVNGLSWLIIVIFIIPASVLRLRDSAAWYNLREFAMPLGKPEPIFRNPVGIANVADIAIEVLEKNPALSDDFADTPVHLNRDERANAALIGCALEKEHMLRRWPNPKWKPFYAAVAVAEDHSTKLVSPQYLKSMPANFYGTLRDKINAELPTTEPKLPGSGEATNDLAKTVSILVKRYNGSVRNIAYRKWRKAPSARLAFNRAQSFPPLDVASMVPQFLKLAIRWGVWQNIKPGNFIYPYSSRLALLLLENRAMLTLSTAKALAFDRRGQLAAYRETMRRIVSKVRENLSASANPQYQTILAAHPTEWDLAASVDVALWTHSSEVKRKDGFKHWKLDNDGLVTRKDNAGAANENTDDEA